MYDPRTNNIPPGYGRIRFSRVELQNILIAVGGLTLAFSLFFGIHYTFPGLSGTEQMVFSVVASLVAVLTGFMLHELGHKIMAQRSGAWAEFRAYPLGLLMAVVFAFVGFIFAAPGAVYIQGMISRRQNGLISLSGPMINMALGVSFLAVAILVNTGLLALALYLIGSINILLAAFNLLPIPPLDGYKVLKWNVPVYVACFGAALVLAILVYTNMILELF